MLALMGSTWPPFAARTITRRRRSTQIREPHSSRHAKGWHSPDASACCHSTSITPGNGAQAAERLGEWAWAHDALGALVEGHPDGLDADFIASCRDYYTAWTGEPDIERGERLLAHATAEGDPQIS